jgi:two-component system CheB/CheR fusion protein
VNQKKEKKQSASIVPALFNSKIINKLDNTPRLEFPIVGIGASAGGLAAFEAFFSGMPSDAEPGMAFVLWKITRQI